MYEYNLLAILYHSLIEIGVFLKWFFFVSGGSSGFVRSNVILLLDRWIYNLNHFPVWCLRSVTLCNMTDRIICKKFTSICCARLSGFAKVNFYPTLFNELCKTYRWLSVSPFLVFLDQSGSCQVSITRKPSCCWQTRATRKHAKHCSNSTCLQRCRWQYWSVFVCLAVGPSEICEILWKLKLIEFSVIQGHRSWCQSKAHVRLPISHQ